MDRKTILQTLTWTAIVLAGALVLEGVRLALLRDITSPVWIAILAAFCLLAAGIARSLRSGQGVSQSPNNAIIPTQNHSNAEPSRNGSEPIRRANESSPELARLNTELRLQIAMCKQAEDIAHASEERFRNLADNILEGLTIFENGRLVFLNERACEIFGDCPEGSLDSRLLSFAAPEERPRLRQLALQAHIDGEFPELLEFWIERQDGSRRFIQERYTSSISGEIQRTFIVSSDITESKQAYQTLKSAVDDRTRELSTMLDVSHRIASTLDLDPLLNLILDQIQSVIAFSGAAIFTLEDDDLIMAACQLPNLPLKSFSIRLGLYEAGIYRQVIDKKQVIIADDVMGDTPLLRALKTASQPTRTFYSAHARSWIGIPLIVRDEVTGLLALTYNQPGYYTQRHAQLAITIANQVAVGIENARLYEQAQNLAVIEERHRIARELHDSVTQILYGICLYCTAASRKLQNNSAADIEQNLVEIKDQALQALQEMRLLILELDPPHLQKAGLVAALQSGLEVIETRTGLATSLTTDGINRLPRTLELELYRIAMEALNNLVRYARAKKVSVDLRGDASWVWMEICDNGVGFNLAEARNNGGMGLHNMEQRAQQLGGKLEISSSPGAGTRIRVEAPIFTLRKN